MGSALAQALLQNGHSVTVWNRTSKKAEPLVREGATLASDPASAVVAGEESTFQQCKPLLQSLAGNLHYLGERVGMANALGVALGSVLFGALLSTLHGARICEVEGVVTGAGGEDVGDDVQGLAHGAAATGGQPRQVHQVRVLLGRDIEMGASSLG